MALRVRPITPADEPAWDAFVHAHEHGSPFHLLAWRNSMRRIFGYAPRYLVAEEDGRIRAVLPLFLVSSPVTGRILLSTPFAVYGGVLADGDESRVAMGRAVEEEGRRERVQYVELRNAHEGQCLGFARVRRYVTFTQELSGTEENLLETIPRKTRAAVRKSLKFDFSSRPTREVEPFANLYLANLKRLGTPAFPLKHFRILLEEFQAGADIREMLLDGGLAAAVFVFYFRDQVLPYYGASDPAFHPQQPNNYMYWELMRWGLNHGYRLFDFGRSKTQESGSFDFKAHWGMTMRELPYEIHLVRRRELPNFSPNNPRFHTFIRLWQSLPLPVANAIGPIVLKLVP
ncbi:MAG: FemAB family PEP-CTERM system-associated protein [Acidobacteria bacterium]|nr:FemAB family PEP-CTERM system-associated protein [Acidobacteriota bacterium]